jgi:hypothetical protein
MLRQQPAPYYHPGPPGYFPGQPHDPYAAAAGALVPAGGVSLPPDLQQVRCLPARSGAAQQRAEGRTPHALECRSTTHSPPARDRTLQDPELRELFQQHLRQMALLRLELEKEKTAAELLRVKVGGGGGAALCRRSGSGPSAPPSAWD